MNGEKFEPVPEMDTRQIRGVSNCGRAEGLKDLTAWIDGDKSEIVKVSGE